MSTRGILDSSSSSSSSSSSDYFDEVEDFIVPQIVANYALLTNSLIKMAQSDLHNTNSSSTEEEPSSESSESESEPENTPSPPKTSDLNLKPSPSNPMDAEPLKNPRSKNPISRYSPPPLTGKRKATEGETESRESKIEKKEVVAGEKKQLFQRLWSEEDEIELIKGMINYVEKKGKDPITDVNDFHEFVKKSLNIDVNNGQMSAKVKRFKKKFMNNVGKIELNGKVRSLSNPHEKKMYELSEKLWGHSRKKVAPVSCSTKKVNVKLPKVGENELHSSGGLGNRGVIRVAMTDEDIIKKGLEFVSGAKKVELEEEISNLKVLELKHFLNKMELMQEQAELVLNAIKKSGGS